MTHRCALSCYLIYASSPINFASAGSLAATLSLSVKAEKHLLSEALVLIILIKLRSFLRVEESREARDG